MNSARSSRSPGVGRNSYVDESLFGKFPFPSVKKIADLNSEIKFISFCQIGSSNKKREAPTMITMEQLKSIRNNAIKGE
jgi:hypothetical protein